MVCVWRKGKIQNTHDGRLKEKDWVNLCCVPRGVLIIAEYTLSPYVPLPPPPFPSYKDPGIVCSDFLSQRPHRKYATGAWISSPIMWPISAEQRLEVHLYGWPAWDIHENQWQENKLWSVCFCHFNCRTLEIDFYNRK